MNYLLDLWNSLCLTICDPLLGWMLWLPTDLILLLLAILTSVLMTAIRRYTSNQDLLTRLDADKKLLKTLQKEAKVRQDTKALVRFKELGRRFALKALPQELGKPLFWSIIPIAILATWAFQRVEFYPPKAGEPLEIRILTATKHDGQLAHLIPQNGLNPRQVVSPLEYSEVWNGQKCALATWYLSPEPGTYNLHLQTEGGQYSFPLTVQSTKYEPTLISFPDETSVEVKLTERKLFRIVPGLNVSSILSWARIYIPFCHFIPNLGFIENFSLAPWLIGYLLLVLPLVFIVRPLMKTH